MTLDTIEDKIHTIVHMDSSDKKYLDKCIREKMDTYKVEYKLPDLTCKHCEKKIDNITVDLTEILFQNIVKA